MKNNCLICTATTLALLCLLITDLEQVNGALDPCHLRELDLCTSSIAIAMQPPPGSKVSEAEITRQCNVFKEADKCMDDYYDNCTMPLQEAMLEFMSGGTMEYMREYCRKGSPTRNKYLKHGDCINKQRKETNRCLVDFQAAIELSTGADETHWRDRPKMMCW